MSVTIPESHVDLLTRPVTVTVVTMMPDGQPQATPTWLDYDGTNLLINTETKRQKARNMRHNPRVTVLAVDHENPSRYLEMRGTVIGETFEGAEESIDKLAWEYAGKKKYFGDYTSEAQRDVQTRVIFTVQIDKVNVKT